MPPHLLLFLSVDEPAHAVGKLLQRQCIDLRDPRHLQDEFGTFLAAGNKRGSATSPAHQNDSVDINIAIMWCHAQYFYLQRRPRGG